MFVVYSPYYTSVFFTALTTSVCSLLRIYLNIDGVLVVGFILQTAEWIAIKFGIGTTENFELWIQDFFLVVWTEYLLHTEIKN